MNIQIKKNNQIKQIGNLDVHNGVYHSFRLEKMYKFNGFAISTIILDFLKAKQCHTIICSGLSTNTSDFYEYGNYWDDNGDEQLVLNLDFFENQGNHCYSEKQETLWN